MYKKNKREFFKLNNKGFAITSIIYSMLLLFIILMTLIILTLGRKKVLLDKSKNETLEFFSQLDNYPCAVTEKNSGEIAIGVGDVVTCKSESFYVIENNGINIKMLAKYNLNVGDNKVTSDTEGIQSVNVPGFVIGGTEPYSGTVTFSNTNYWSSNTNYPIFVYNNNSTLYQYVENYALHLRNILQVDDISASLISYEQMIRLGCNATNNSCENAPSWLHLVSYWIGSAYNTTNILGMNSNGLFGNGQYSSNNVYGVRPLVTVPTNIVRNTMPNVVKTGPTAEEPPSGETGYTGVLKIIYLDPTDLTKNCTVSDVNSDTGTKTGCMKWYAYAETDTTYTLLLDHNTTADVAWISKEDYIAAGGTEADYGTYGNNTKGPITVNKQLVADTTNWDSVLSPRLITANEIATIVGKTGWNSYTATVDSDIFYFETLTNSQPNPYPSISKYSWLYDRFTNCKNYGCLNTSVGASTNGYWTSNSDALESDRAWCVCNTAALCNHLINLNIPDGIRPVITVQKSLFK